MNNAFKMSKQANLNTRLGFDERGNQITPGRDATPQEVGANMMERAKNKKGKNVYSRTSVLIARLMNGIE